MNKRYVKYYSFCAYTKYFAYDIRVKFCKGVKKNKR